MSSAPGPARVSRFGWSDRAASSSTVLIASSDPELRERWKVGLERGWSVREVSERGSLERLITTLAPDVVLLDLDLLKLGGIGDGPVIRALSRQTRIVLLTGAPNDREGIRTLKAGARGYLDRNLDVRFVRRLVERVKEGEIWAERKLIAQLLEEYAYDPDESELPASADSRLDPLTPREREIAELIGAGASNKQIAGRLGVGEGTVKAHLTAIFRKLGFSDRLQLGLFLVNPGVQRPSAHT